VDQDFERGGWIALAVGGGINFVFGVIYLIWTLVSLVISGFMVFASISAAVDSGGGPGEIIPAVIMAMMPLIQVIVYILVPIMAAVVLFAAMRYRSYRSKGLVWLGVVLNVGIPLLALVSSLGSCCGGCCGFVTGNVGTVIVGVIALITSGYAAYTLIQDDVALKFAANEEL